MNTLSKLGITWNGKHIALSSKTIRTRALVIPIFLYVFKSWTLNKDLDKIIQGFEVRCFRILLGITYKDRLANEELYGRIIQAADPNENLLY